ncbi:hypothetical protein BC835DRAFT_1349846 [Cytidiella melzeri]|nr:hypothetical protein BC835DRAFT_1349846 [Cytidiella melzeri]
MLRTEFITSPSESARPLEPKPDVDSDDLWLSKFKSKKKKNKGKTTLSPSFIPSSEVAVISDSRTESPLSRFKNSVTQMTGYSPLNPTSSLHDEFHASHLSGLVTDSDYPRNRSPPASLRQLHIPTPLSRVPSEGTISDSSSNPMVSYETIRPLLFQQALIASINGAKFDDTDIYVYSARSRSGQVHKPRAVRARRAFLNAACPKFEHDIVLSARFQGPVKASCTTDRQAYGYDADSDLEECEGEQLTRSTHVSTSGSPPKEVPGTVQPGTSKSSVLNLSDGDVMSLDGIGSETGLSEILQETSLGGPSTQSGMSTKPSFSTETAAAVLNWRNEHEHKDATPRDALTDLPRRTSLIVEEEPVSPLTPIAGEITLFVPDSAHRTWQALLLYLYNDYIQFAPLRSEGQPSRLLTFEDPSCSPKSMYRLAAKLGLENLKQKAYTAIEQALSKDNVVKELFSDFTWRYPEVLAMETNVFYKYSCEAVVQAAMSETFQDIARGQLPHSSVVLSSLFNRFVGGDARPMKQI